MKRGKLKIWKRCSYPSIQKVLSIRIIFN